MQTSERRLASALHRGVRGRCPACGRGRLFRTYITPAATCAACGEDLSRYQTADFAPYIVTFVVGLIFTPLALVLTMSGATAFTPGLLLAAVVCAVSLLPLMKGAALGLLWAVNETN